MSVRGIASAHSWGHPDRLENRKGRCGQGTQQKKRKIENQEKKEQKAKILGKCLSGVIASAHSWGHLDRLENRKGRCGQGTQQKKKKIENQEKRNRRLKS